MKPAPVQQYPLVVTLAGHHSVPGNANAITPHELRNEQGEVVLALGTQYVVLAQDGSSQWCAAGYMARVGAPHAPLARSIGAVVWKREAGARRAATRWLVDGAAAIASYDR